MKVTKYIKILLFIVLLALSMTCFGSDKDESAGNASFIEWLFNEKSSDKKDKSVEISDDFIDTNENGIDDRFERTKNVKKEYAPAPTIQYEIQSSDKIQSSNSRSKQSKNIEPAKRIPSSMKRSKITSESKKKEKTPEKSSSDSSKTKKRKKNIIK